MGAKIITAHFQNKDYRMMKNADQVDKARQFAATASSDELLQPLLATINELQNKFGRWQIPWGEINRFQRISSDIENKFDDSKAKHPCWICIFHLGNVAFLYQPNFSGH